MIEHVTGPEGGTDPQHPDPSCDNPLASASFSKDPVPPTEVESLKTKTSEGRARYCIRQDGIAEVQLGDAREGVLRLTRDRLDSLKEIVSELTVLAQAREIKGVIFISGHPKMFCAGADISLFQKIENRQQAFDFIREGQALFREIASLPVKTVAVIHGLCLGGGLEFALNCDHIVASDSPQTSLGFPEVKLGILPGWTGTQVAPRKMGLPNALKLMQSGEPIDARAAQQNRLVDHVCHESELESAAQRIISGDLRAKLPRLSLKDWIATKTSFGRNKTAATVKAILEKKKLLHLPAPKKILESALYGLEEGIEKGLAREARIESELLFTPESRAFVNVHFAIENAKEIGRRAKPDMSQQHALVVGAGVMGAGIAGVFSKSGAEVSLQDTSKEQLERGREAVERILEHSRSLSDEEKAAQAARLNLVQETPAAEKNVSTVVEAVPEILELKKKLLGAISASVSSEAIVATNTSSLSVTELSSCVEHPERFIGMHFFNPAERMKLIEIIPGAETSERTINQLSGIATRLGKLPIVVKDVPGFLVNRMLMPYLNEAGFLLREGVPAEQIERVAVEFGMPMGPIRLLDEIGLDTAEKVGKVIHSGYADRMRQPESFGAILAEQKFGRVKSQAGFYRYDSPSDMKGALDLETLGAFSGSVSNPELSDEEVRDRLVLVMVNEAIRCLDEGVAGEEKRSASLQIDLGSVMGFGFPPHRGGLIQYARERGAKDLKLSLEHLAERFGKRFVPSEGVVARAEHGDGF